MVGTVNRRYGFWCPVRQILFWYACCVFLYEIWTILMFNPIMMPSTCGPEDAQLEYPTVMLLVFAFLQNVGSVMLLVLQYMLVAMPKTCRRVPWMSLALAGGCCLVSLVPTFLASPNTVQDSCGVRMPELNNRYQFAWSSIKFLLMCGLALYGMARPREGMANKESKEAASQSWSDQIPKGVLLTIITMNAAKVFVQLLNNFFFDIMHENVRGSFAAMLILESLMEHAQPVVLLLSFLCDRRFTSLVHESLGFWLRYWGLRRVTMHKRSQSFVLP